MKRAPLSPYNARPITRSIDSRCVVDGFVLPSACTATLKERTNIYVCIQKKKRFAFIAFYCFIFFLIVWPVHERPRDRLPPDKHTPEISFVIDIVFNSLFVPRRTSLSIFSVALHSRGHDDKDGADATLSRAATKVSPLL